MHPYLQQLTLRLANGVSLLPDSTIAKHAAYFRGMQRPDGGFAGREGESDLYYTGFGLRAMSVLGELYGAPAEQAAKFLSGRLSGKESIVDFLSLIYGGNLLQLSAGIDIYSSLPLGWQDRVVETLMKLRRDDGGFSKTPEGNASSTYHTFLVVLCLQLIDRPIPSPERIVEFIKSQEDEDGGFHEIRVAKRAGSNPTAAAVGTLKILNALDEETSEGVIDFLCEMQDDDGGFKANSRIPIADILSTFTAIVTLQDLNALEEIDVNRLKQFVRKVAREEGGFHAALWDDKHDVEYSFYGLGSEALLALFDRG